MTTSIRTPFGFSSTADDVIEGIDLSGRRAIVTGGASGIGVETARALASAGAEVTLAVRRTAAGDQVAADLVRSTGNEAIFVQPLELSDQRSVTRFVDRWTGPLHILVNNAGIMATPELERTAEGWELQFATNFTSTSGPTTPSWPTGSPRPPRPCSPSRPRGAGRTRASTPTR
jgi:NAD(P)-dependent dehydrogenase (short-subunit alcohol dehydrogenase family)